MLIMTRGKDGIGDVLLAQQTPVKGVVMGQAAHQAHRTK